MAELTPEEKERIYLEEKERYKARKAIEAQDDRVYRDEKIRHQAREHSSLASCFYGCILIVVIIVLSAIFIPRSSNVSTPSYNTSSTYSAPATASTQAETLQKEIKADEATDKAKVQIVGADWKTNDTSDFIAGEVSNHSEKTVWHFKIKAEFLNLKGDVIHTIYKPYDQAIEPSESMPFNIAFHYPRHAVKFRSNIEDIEFYDREKMHQPQGAPPGEK